MDRNTAERMTVTWLGEVVDELGGGRDGASGDGVLDDLVPVAVARRGDQSAAHHTSDQSVFLRD